MSTTVKKDINFNLDKLVTGIRAEVIAAAKSKFEEIKAAKNLSNCGLFIDDKTDKFTFVYDLGEIRRLYTEMSSNKKALPT